MLKFRFVRDDGLRGEYRRLRLPAPPKPLPPPQFGKIFTPAFDYAEARRLVSTSTLFASARAQKALACVSNIWHDKVRDMLFIDLNFASQVEIPCSLDAFKVCAWVCEGGRACRRAWLRVCVCCSCVVASLLCVSIVVFCCAADTRLPPRRCAGGAAEAHQGAGGPPHRRLAQERHERLHRRAAGRHDGAAAQLLRQQPRRAPFIRPAPPLPRRGARHVVAAALARLPLVPGVDGAAAHEVRGDGREHCWHGAQPRTA